MSTHNICFHEEKKYQYFLSDKCSLSGAMEVYVLCPHTYREGDILILVWILSA